MTTAHNCPICGYPIVPAGIPWGYTGPTCPGHYYGYQQYGQYGRYSFTPLPVTADDIRRIVREELERDRQTKEPPRTCQHDLQKPLPTVVVNSPYSAECLACGEVWRQIPPAGTKEPPK